MNTPEQHSLNDRLNKISDDLVSIKKQLRSLFVFMIVILSVIVSPTLILPAIVAYIVWQFIDVLHSRSQRKRREQLAFQQLSGRIPFQKQTPIKAVESTPLRFEPHL